MKLDLRPCEPWFAVLLKVCEPKGKRNGPITIPAKVVEGWSL